MAVTKASEQGLVIHHRKGPQRSFQPRHRENITRVPTARRDTYVPAHVVTLRTVIGDLMRVAKTSMSAKVVQRATAVLRLMAQFAKNPPRTASQKDIRAVRSLWWIFSNQVLTAKEKRGRTSKSMIRAVMFNDLC